MTAAAQGPAGLPGSGVVEERLQLRHHRLGVSGADVAQRVLQRRLELFVAERLEQVGGRVRVERAQRVFVVRVTKTTSGIGTGGLSRTSAENAEAIELRHLDVQEHQLHGRAGLRGSAQNIERFGAARAGAGELHPVVARQQPPQALASRLLVVHDQRARGRMPARSWPHRRVDDVRSSRRRPGKSICTSTPPVGMGTSFSRFGVP